MRVIPRIMTALCLVFLYQIAVYAQTTGSIAGTIVDSNGAVVPNATVTVKGTAGQEFTATTNSNGIFNIPAVQNGFYTVTISANGFKTSVVSNVKVDVGTPSTVDAALEVGAVGETVEITSGGEVLQTQTATIGTNIQGRQITETPTASRDALDLVALLPGTASVGAPRRSSVNGLPKGSLSITIDGVDVQDNLLRSSDGFFTYVRPRIDAIDEVTVSTAAGGADSGGDGAVQIKFVTRRGTNDYNGGLYWQHRNTALNAAYWYNNRDLKPLPGDDKAPRNKIILNQYGGRFGGPIPFLGLGEGVPIFNSGKDKRFFFVNYEEFRLPESQSRTRTVLTPQAQAGNFSYITSTGVQTVNVYDIARANNQLATPDPTIASVLARIRSAVSNAGTLTPVTNSPNTLFYNFTPAGGQLRRFLAVRLDFNLNKSNSLEFITNRQKFVPSKDFLNAQEERFPGFPSYTQGSDRNSYATALRSTFSQSIVNEARFTVSTGLSTFSEGISAADFAYSGGYSLSIVPSGITTPYSRNSFSSRNTPTYDFTDNVTWTFGNHAVNFGGQIKLIKAEGTALNRIVPTVGFGIDNTDSAAFNMFNTTSLPGATAAQLTEARTFYANLVGRVTTFTTAAYLGPDGRYQENGPIDRIAEQYTYGLYAQDSWRIRPNLTFNYGLRWQPQTAFTAISEGNYTRLEDFAQIYGLSGLGNIFKPGTLTGTVPRVVPLKKGEKAYSDDWNNFAPSAGVVWSPNPGEKGLLRNILGENGKSVFRAGYSMSFVREGFNLLESINGANPGGSINASRSLTIGNLTVGTNLRDPGNPNLTAAPFSTTPNFPITLTTSDVSNAFDPNLRTGYVHSFSFGYQRELDKNTVVEFRYVGNRGRDLQRQYDLNEFNTIENGFANEFLKAQNNLYANEAAFAAGQTNRRACPAFVNTATGACQTSATNTTAVARVPTYAYYGANTGTTPLPIMLAYFNSATNYDPNNPARYAVTNFANTTLVNALSRLAPNILAFSGSNFELNTGRRNNAVANGLPINFFYVNPSTASAASTGAFIIDNSQKTWYDSGVIEVRRRLSNSLRFQANYVWSKAFSNAFQSSSVVFSGFSQREGGIDLAKNVQAYDIRHNFKFDATYDLPFGKGKQFFSNAGGFVNQLVGGFTLFPTIRWQSGSPISFGNVQLVGMTVKDLQKSIGVYKKPDVVNYLPDDIILNTQRAFDINVNNANGYGTTYGGAPSGRYLAPAGTGNCLSRFVGECGFNNLIVYGPSFFKFDIAVSKKFNISERRNIEFRATFLDALNAPNFRVGGFGADVVSAGVGGATFGQLANGSAYQDISTTNDPGGRLIDLMLRINF